MSYLTQSKLQRQVEVFVGNGQLSQAQAAIATVGYDPAELEAGTALLAGWRTCKMRAQALLAAQKKATQAERAARSAASQEVSNFRTTVQVLFGDDEPLLTSLGLRQRRELVATNGQVPENGTGTGAETEEEAYPANGNGRSYPSASAAATIARWRLLFNNAQVLEESYKAELAKAGWDEARLAAAYAEADTTQQEQIQSYRAESARPKPPKPSCATGISRPNGCPNWPSSVPIRRIRSSWPSYWARSGRPGRS